MDLIEQSSLNWNSELFDKVFIDFAYMDIGEPIKSHKLITSFRENIELLMTSCMKYEAAQLALSLLVFHHGPGLNVDINMYTISIVIVYLNTVAGVIIYNGRVM